MARDVDGARDVARLRSGLLAWYDAQARDLPWRRTRDPYAIWVSEAMLQQTRVETVLPYYVRWMERFPTVASLAAAPEPDAVALWSGLGYYARARALHRAAREVVLRHGGAIPRDPEALAALPGFGPYTTAAVASIAFGVPRAAVDGNVVRVLARLDGVRGDLRGLAARRRLQARADEVLDAARPGDWNQALMDLGATVCTPRSPRCGDCPVAALCRARAEGTAAQIPPPRPRAAVPTARLRFAVVVRGGAVLLRPPEEDGLLAGTWRLPGGAVPDVAALHAAVEEQTGVAIEAAPRARRVRHVFSHRAWLMQVHAAAPRGGAAARPRGGAAWVPLSGLGSRPMSAAVLRALAAAGATPDAA